MSIEEKIKIDLYPLFHAADIFGETTELFEGISKYLERGTTSDGTPIPDELKTKVLNGEL